MVKQIVSCGYLRSNLLRLINRVNKGFPNLLLIWGATRSGKTTIAVQCATFLSQELNVPFNVNHVFFNVNELNLQVKKGVDKSIYLLDEAAFDLMGEDWHKGAQKELQKLIMTAAMYKQTLIIVIPYIEKLRYFLIKEDHARGIRTYINKSTLQRGFYMGYSHDKLQYVYNALLTKRYDKFRTFINKFKGRFNKQMDYIDEEKYLAKKKDAINKIDDVATDKRIIQRNKLVCYMYSNKLASQPKLADISGLSVKMIQNIIADGKKQGTT